MFNSLFNGIKEGIKWSLPYGLINEIRTQRKILHENRFYKKVLDYDRDNVLTKNHIFKDIGKDKRCFLVGTGPSINKQNMLHLKGENCIFLNEFYLHKDISNLAPTYYLSSGFFLHRDVTSNDVGLRFYHNIENKIPNSCALFLNILDKKLIVENKLFENHKVYYLIFKKDINDVFRYGIDLCGLLYGASAISSMALQIALYMGFSEIYLLGWDGLRRGGKVDLKDHFYDANKSAFRDCSSPQKETYSYWEIECKQVLCMLNELKQLHKFAQQQGINIYNVTEGSIIDFFPMMKFESLFDK